MATFRERIAYGERVARAERVSVLRKNIMLPQYRYRRMLVKSRFPPPLSLLLFTQNHVCCFSRVVKKSKECVLLCAKYSKSLLFCRRRGNLSTGLGLVCRRVGRSRERPRKCTRDAGRAGCLKRKIKEEARSGLSRLLPSRREGAH